MNEDYYSQPLNMSTNYTDEYTDEHTNNISLEIENSNHIPVLLHQKQDHISMSSDLYECGDNYKDNKYEIANAHTRTIEHESLDNANTNVTETTETTDIQYDTKSNVELNAELNVELNVELNMDKISGLPPRPPVPDIKAKSLKIYYDKILGRGSFAKVFPGIYKDNLIAIKIITIKHLEKAIALQLERELQVIKILQSCPHKNIVSYYKIFQLDDKMIICMELCSGGELTKYIKIGLDLETVKNYFSQILDGYRHLLELNIVHRDIKSANLLLSQDKKTIKFIDFGLSKIFSTDLNQTICGSPLYMAPEVLDNQDYNSKSDIWSLGVLLYEMVYGHTPFHQCTVIKTLKQTVQRNQIVYPEKSTKNLYIVPLSLITYMKRLLEPNPKNRINWNEIQDAKWLTDNYISDIDSITPSPIITSISPEIITCSPIYGSHGIGPSLSNVQNDLSLSQVEEKHLHLVKMATRSPYYKPSLGYSPGSGQDSGLDKQIDMDKLDLNNISKEDIISTISKELRDSSPKIKMISIKNHNKKQIEHHIDRLSDIEFKESDIDILKLTEKISTSVPPISRPMNISIPERHDTHKSIHSSMVSPLPHTSYRFHHKTHNKTQNQGIRRESVGLIKPSDLNINDVSFIANDFSTDFDPLLNQQKKMASNSGLIDIDDVSYMVVTNVPEKTTTYEYISKGTVNIGSYLFSKSAPIASSFMGNLENIAKSAANILTK
jgi:serine/threonine protein kinase